MADAAMTDLAWRGYHPRAMAPGVAAAAAVSAALLAGRWLIADWAAAAERIGALLFFGAAAGVWLLVLAAGLYRTVTYTYRLTDRALLIDRGFLTRPADPVWLRDVTAVAAGWGPVGRPLGVGWVRVTAADGRSVRLAGVRRPHAFAARIRKAAGASTG